MNHTEFNAFRHKCKYFVPANEDHADECFYSKLWKYCHVERCPRIKKRRKKDRNKKSLAEKIFQALTSRPFTDDRIEDEGRCIKIINRVLKESNHKQGEING